MNSSIRYALAVLTAATLAVAFTPSPVQAASAKKVTCKDGTTDDSGRGACSGHGGVDKAATDKAKTDAKAEAKAKKDAGKAETKVKKDAEKTSATSKEKTDTKKDSAKSEAKTAKETIKTAPGSGATVFCKDGTTSAAGRGACSGHGGVDKGATGKATKAASGSTPTGSTQAGPAPTIPASTTSTAPATPTAPVTQRPAATTAEKVDPAKGPPTARCKDGSLSYAKHHSGACSGHGGVAEWLDKQ